MEPYKQEYKKYPVLYLLHGFGGDVLECDQGQAEVVMSGDRPLQRSGTPRPLRRSAVSPVCFSGCVLYGQSRSYFPAVVSPSSRPSKVSLVRNRSEMHQIPASATTVYTIRAHTDAEPPHNHATMSKRNSPMLPQFSAPMMEIISAIRSMITVTTSPFLSATADAHTGGGKPAACTRSFGAPRRIRTVRP